ncbi:MAG: DUF1990 family protein [Armatimonadetes bacterium]|nr:DUF1990 family protein [Armatimonadota bacterium]
MDAVMEKRFRAYESAPLSWDPTKGGKRSFVCFEDSISEIVAEQAQPGQFEQAARQMLAGDYYPADAVQFFGRFRDENRNLAKGERVLQRARFFPFYAGLYLWSMVEIYVVEQTENTCRIGYVTTQKHHGRGIWTATLEQKDGKLTLTVESTACPNSWAFWLGLPIARYLQLRARSRGIENIRSQLSRSESPRPSGSPNPS